MIRLVCFFDIEDRKILVETARDYKEIIYLVNKCRYIILESKICSTKKAWRKYEKECFEKYKHYLLK